jgi:exonuclease SbcC
MIPVELRLHNFLAYQDPDPLRLEGIHIACLAGPNGAGKSSILDAITWCIWGKARSNSADELIHQGRDEMQVSLVFDQAEVRYRVMRQRTGGKRGASLLDFQVWNGTGETWQPISEGAIRETQAKIDQTLNLDYETFVNSAFLVQGRADEFTTKTPGQRKQVLASILGLSQWEVYEGRAKDRIQESRASIQRLEGRLEEVEKELDQRDTHLVELKEAEKAAEDVSKRLAETEKQWADLEQTRNLLVGLHRQLEDLSRRVATREKEIREAEAERQTSLERADKSALAGVIADLREQLKKVADSQVAWDATSKHRAETAEWAAKLRGMNQTLGPETEPLKVRAQTLERATEPICPTCGQALTEDHRHTLVAELTQEIEGRRETYRLNLDRIRELEQETGEAGPVGSRSQAR